MKPVVIYGAGGLGREVRQLIEDINVHDNAWQFTGFVVTDKSSLTDRDSQDEVVGDEEWLLRQAGGMAVAVAIGNPVARREVVSRIAAGAASLDFPNLIHPSAIIGAGFRAGKGNIICANNVLTVGVRIGDFNYLNLSCTVGHEAALGNYTVVNPGGNISGGVTIGDAVLVGTNATILQYLTVGDGATIGAGALVNRNVLGGVVVVGVPAKPIRKLDRQ